MKIAMSLETLLEAAKYIEYRSEVKARGEEPHDYYTFSKLCSASGGSSPSYHVSPPSQSQKNAQHSSNSQSSEEVREKRRSGSSTSRDSSSKEHGGGSGTREVHNKLEKNRRAHLKECFEALKKQLPNMDDRKTSNLSILRGALRCIQILKRKEREHEHDLEKLARDKIAFQQQLAALKKEMSAQYDHIDVNALISVEENETTTTASECGGGSDIDEDFASEPSPVSNHSTPKHTPDAKNQVPSPRVTSSTPKPAATTAGFPKSTHTSSLSPSSGLPRGSSSDTSASSIHTKSRPAAETSGLHLLASDGVVSSSSRFVSAGSLHTMAGIVSPSHAVQVITPPSGIKLLAAAGASVASQATIQPFTVSPHHQQHHGQIHVLTSNLPYVATAGSKSGIPDQLVQVTDLSTQSKPQASSPVALVSSKAFVAVTQIATATAQPVIVSQASTISELMSSSVSSLPSSGLVKAASPVSNKTIAMTLKNSAASSDPNGPNVSYSISRNSLNASKSCQPSLNQTLPENLKIVSTSRQVPTSGHQHSSTSSSVCSNLLTHSSNISQFSSPIAVPANHLVGAGVSPFVGSVSVVSHTGAALHHQVLAQSQPLSKVLASPILKSFNNQIPIIQQQFLQAPGAVSSQHIVKPVVVVSMPNIIHSNSITSLASRHVTEQPESVCGSTTGSQK